jgi:hypothetical protein
LLGGLMQGVEQDGNTEQAREGDPGGEVHGCWGLGVGCWVLGIGCWGGGAYCIQ